MTSDAMRLNELRAFIGLCFMEFEKRHMDVRVIAESSRLSTTTIYKLRKNGVTLASRFGTVSAIGEVAGMKLILTKRSVKMTVRKKVA